MADIEKEIAECCKQLRISNNFSAQAMTMKGETPQEFLLNLLHNEIEYRTTRRISKYANTAGFPRRYTVEEFRADEIDFPEGVNLNSLLELDFYHSGKNVIDGIGDQVTSAFNTNTFGVNGSNSQELGYSSYVSPNRILFNVGWTWPSGKRSTETIGLYYEGFNHCYIGNFSYTRYSYTMTTNVNGDGGANSLIYIPTETELSEMPFVSEENAEDFNQFIMQDKYLNNHRGEYAERGGAIAPWRHTFNFKYERTIKFNGGEKLSFGIDVNNIANLIYRGWGNMQRLNSSDILKYSKNSEGNYQYEFTNPTWSEYASTYSTWSAALNVRLSF